jgi:hypothetical protein
MDLYEDLEARGGEVREDQRRDLRARWEAWERNPSKAMPGEVFIAARPTGRWTWERIATRLGLEPLAEPVAAEKNPAATNSPPHVGKPGPKATRPPKDLETRLMERIKNPDTPGNLQREIAEEFGLSRDQVKYQEGRLRRRLGLAQSDPANSAE